MTKPAEGQIAKARRISEIAEREKKATKGPWLGDVEQDGTEVIYVPLPDVANDAVSVLFDADWATEDDVLFALNARADIPFLLSELASERQAVKEECCRAVCKQCAESFFWAAATKRGDKWIHSCLNIPGVAPCDAAAIRSMGE